MLKEILKNSSGVPTGEYKDVAGGTLYADSPLGTILPFGGAAAPIGWFLCQGQAISRITYADLFAVIGTSFGAGDGSTTFNIPDLRGEFLRGAGTNSHSGQGDGGAVGEHQNGTTVATSIMGNGYGVIYNMANGFVDNSTYDKWVGNSGNTYLHNTTGQETETYETRIGIGKTRPTNTSVNYIIKAEMVALPADLEAGVDAKIAADKTSSIASGNTKSVTSGAVFSGLTDIVKVVDAVGSITLEANSQKQVTLSFTCPAGYKAVLATPKSAGSWAFVWAFCYLTSQSSVYAVIKSCLAADETQNVYATVLCVKTSF